MASRTSRRPSRRTTGWRSRRAERAAGLIAAAVVALGVTACRRSEPEAERQARAAATPIVQIFVDERAVAGVTLEPDRPVDLALVLADLAPRATWKELEARAPGGRTALVQHIPQSYLGQDAILERVAGHTRFAMIRTPNEAVSEAVRAAGRSASVSLDGVTEVRIHTRDRVPAPGAAAASGSVDLLIGGKLQTTWTPAALAAVATMPAPGKGARGDGWDLGPLIAKAAGAGAHTIRLVDRDGRAVDVAGDALADRILFLKFNRRGDARLRVFARATPEKPIDELTSLKAVEIDRSTTR
jgi:hypothetical protein